MKYILKKIFILNLNKFKFKFFNLLINNIKNYLALFLLNNFKFKEFNN